MKPSHQTSPYDSPWSATERLAILAWGCCWILFCRWTPKPLNGWRLFWLKLFGAKITGLPFVHPRARIQIPWHLTLHDRASIGDRTNLYSLGPIEIAERATVAQEAYLCTGTHTFNDPSFPLEVLPIRIGRDSFIGARAFILPGITIGDQAVVGAGSLVTRNVPDGAIVAGNPARPISSRTSVS